MSKPTILAWKPVFGDRAVHFAETAIGVFRTRAAGRRCVLSLNDVRIGNHGDSARARRQAERLIEALLRPHAQMKIRAPMRQERAGQRTEAAAPSSAPAQRAAPPPPPRGRTRVEDLPRTSHYPRCDGGVTGSRPEAASDMPRNLRHGGAKCVPIYPLTPSKG
jgi:hypothetical protein